MSILKKLFLFPFQKVIKIEVYSNHLFLYIQMYKYVRKIKCGPYIHKHNMIKELNKKLKTKQFHEAQIVIIV